MFFNLALPCLSVAERDVALSFEGCISRTSWRPSEAVRHALQVMNSQLHDCH